MDSRKLNMLLIENFPNLINEYNEEVEWQEGDDTGSHVVYGDVFTPYFVECIKQNNEIEVIKILEFIEKILEIGEKYSSEVIAFSVLEGVEYEFRDSSLLNENYGNLSKKIIKEIQDYNSQIVD